MNFYHELTQLDIKETEASRRSYLLYPYRVIIESSEEVRVLHPNLAGEYRKVAKADENKRPVWQHSKHLNVKMVSTGARWTIKDGRKQIARSPVTNKNMLESSLEWEYYDSSNNGWVQGFGDVFINLFPDVDDDNRGGDVMLITGGSDGNNRLSSVEIFDPNNPSLTCSLPDMTVTREHHAAVGMTVCGGNNYKDGSQSCETLDGQQWTVTHQLEQKRWAHVMWQSPSKGIMNMGGWYSGTENTVETLQDDGSSEMEQWNLKYDTRYGDSTNIVSMFTILLQ